jgi:hypothetical protein
MNVTKLYVNALKNNLIAFITIIRYVAVTVAAHGIEVCLDKDKAKELVSTMMEFWIADDYARNFILGNVVFATAKDIFIRDGGDYNEILKNLRKYALIAIEEGRFVSDYVAEYDKYVKVVGKFISPDFVEQVIENTKDFDSSNEVEMSKTIMYGVGVVDSFVAAIEEVK